MIEIGGIYKLKKIKGFDDDNNDEFEVIKIINDTALCIETKTNQRFVFLTRFLIDPDNPKDDTFYLIEKL